VGHEEGSFMKQAVQERTQNFPGSVMKQAVQERTQNFPGCVCTENPRTDIIGRVFPIPFRKVLHPPPPPPSSLYSRYRVLPLLETPLKLTFLESLVGRFNIFLDFMDQLKGAVVPAIAFKEKWRSYKDQIREKGEWDKTDMF
jgi:hypothetical protein